MTKKKVEESTEPTEPTAGAAVEVGGEVLSEGAVFVEPVGMSEALTGSAPAAEEAGEGVQPDDSPPAEDAPTEAPASAPESAPEPAPEPEAVPVVAEVFAEPVAASARVQRANS